MICDQDPLRRRPRKSTVRRKRQEGCVWMAEIMGNWPSGHGQITKIWPPDRCGGKTISAAMQFGYNLREFGGYLGNVGSTACADRRRAPERKTSVSGSSENDPGWRRATTVSSFMAYPFLRKIGVFINARIRHPIPSSPRFSYSSVK